MDSAINIILDESVHPKVFFVEVELDDGRSISIGERIDYNGLIRLRITANDILNAQPGKQPCEVHSLVVKGDNFICEKCDKTFPRR